jgi:hypothetical protein
MVKIPPEQREKPMTANLTVVTRDKLIAGQRQTLTLEITTEGHPNVFLIVPIGDSAAALMATSADNFRAKVKTKVALLNNPKQVRLDDERGATQTEGWVKFIISGGQSTTFAMSFQDFFVPKAPGTASITLKDRNGNILVDRGGKTPAQVSAEKIEAKQAIMISSFTAKPYNLVKGGTVILSWILDPQNGGYQYGRDFVLVPGPDEQPTCQFDKQNRRVWSARLQVKGTTDCILQTLVNGEKSDLRQVQIHSFGKSAFESYQLRCRTARSQLDAVGVVGLHVHPENGRLYVLLREDADSATLWSTAHGFSADAKEWTPEVDGRGRTICIPVQAARRPGVIFQKKLWLMGGDSCHPDRPGSEVGYYDFQATTWFGGDQWPNLIGERMGHAVVVVDDRLWVIGGWSQNGGARNDIWEFDGVDASQRESWTQLPQPNWMPRCLFGATVTSSAVWVAGGFRIPGGAPTYDDILRWDKTTKRWEAVEQISLSPDKTDKDRRYQLCAATLLPLDDQPCAVTTFFDSNDSNYVRSIRFIKNERGGVATRYDIEDTSMEGVLLGLDYYRLDSVAFGGCMFIRALKPDPQWTDPNVHFLVRVGAAV